jgi:type IV secretory pathway protease TraF
MRILSTSSSMAVAVPRSIIAAMVRPSRSQNLRMALWPDSPTPLTPGMLVVLPVPASVQPWHSRWLPLLKPVAATAGQDVCVQEDTLWIGGQSYGPVRHEAHGRRVPHIEGCATVEPGMVFLASHAPASLDGRYFGSTPVSTLTARALPVLTWEARPPCRKFEGSLGVSR